MGEAAKKDEEEKLIPVGPGADDLPEKSEKETEEPEDERLAQADDESEDDDKPRKRESSKERRERAKKAHSRDRLELEYWRKRGEALEKRFMEMEQRQSHTETSAIDTRINTVSSQLANARRVMADSLKAPNGTGADQYEEALKIYDELREQLGELKGSKKQHVQRSQERAQEPAREEPADVKPHPRVVTNARDWASKHKWFSFDGDDEDSAIVRTIDEKLAKDGFDPTEDDYWEELTARVKRRLPERFKKGVKARPADDDEMDDEEDEREVRNSTGPKFSSGGRERPLKKGEVYVSAERKQAMKEYGVWDDPTARNRMLKKYAQWDAETASSNKR
jgi:hypothetical protein